MWTVSKSFTLEAAHSLPHLPETHKCHRLHGHSYEVIIHCSGDLIPDHSWVIDYADISKIVDPIIARLDHQNLNDVMGIHTTAENIAFWLYIHIRHDLSCLYAVEVKETAKTSVIYKPR